MFEIIFITLFVLAIFTLYFFVVVPTIHKGREMAKNDPVHIKKGQLVYYNNILCEVLTRNKNFYYLKGIRNKELINHVDRNKIKLAS